MKRKKTKKKASRKTQSSKKKISSKKLQGKVISLRSKKGDKNLKEMIRDLIVRGRKFFDDGHYDEALPLLKKVNELDGDLPDVLNMLGLIYHNKGKFNKALNCFEEALSINPHYTEASLNLAVTCNDLGRFQEAKFVYARAKKTAPPGGDLDPYVKGKLANMHAEIADVYQTLGHHLEASEEFRKALKLRPTFVDIQTKLGVALREIGKRQESLEILISAYKNESQYTPAAIHLGLTYFSMGNTRDAVKVWKNVLKQDPQNDKAKMYLRLVK